MNIFLRNFFFEFFFSSSKTIFSSELELFLRYSFDVKFCGLSIYDVFRVIRALLRGFKSSLLFYNRTNPVLERCVALVLSWGRPWFWAKSFQNFHFFFRKKSIWKFLSEQKKIKIFRVSRVCELSPRTTFSARSEHSGVFHTF